jgi:hypothetical protein
MLTRERDVTWGMSDAWWHGMTRGALHGFFAMSIADDKVDSDKAIVSALSLGSLAEGIGFTAYANLTKASAGTTNSLGKGSDFGSGFAIGATALVTDPSDLTLRGAAVSGLLGAAGGYAGGYYYARERKPTWGDVEVLRTTGVVGAYAGVLPLILGEVENDRAYVFAAMVGGAGGLVLGDFLLRDRDFTTGQGIVTELSTFAGGAAGAGIGYLISPGDNLADAKIIATGAILGAAGGFALTYYGLDTKVAPSAGAPPVTFQLVPDVTPERKGLVIAGSF